MSASINTTKKGKVGSNRRNIQHPLTSAAFQTLTYRRVAALSPQGRVQCYLDAHEMSVVAQSRVTNDWQLTISEWMNTLP